MKGKVIRTFFQGKKCRDEVMIWIEAFDNKINQKRFL